MPTETEGKIRKIVERKGGRTFLTGVGVEADPGSSDLNAKIRVGRGQKGGMGKGVLLLGGTTHGESV